MARTRQLGTTAIVVAALALAVFPAESPAAEGASAALSPDGGTLAVSDPTRGRTVVYRRGSGDGLQPLWAVAGWYPLLFPANGGGRLVAAAGEVVASADDGAQAIFLVFERGARVGEVTLDQALDDLASLQPRDGGYAWGEMLGFDETGAFEVLTVENYQVAFNLGEELAEGATATDAGADAASAAPAEDAAPVWRVSVDYGRGLGEMVADGYYSGVDPGITAEHFVVDASGPAEVEFDLVAIGRGVTGQQALDELQARGYRPATIAELLAFGARYPDEQLRRNAIAALGTIWKPGRSSGFAAYLQGKGTRRYLKTYAMADIWVDSTTFLVVADSP